MLPEADTADIAPKDDSTIHLDYRDEKSWSLFNKYCYIVFTCKLNCPQSAERLSQKLKHKKKIILLSTAKAFTTSTAGETINENFRLDASLRNSAESQFLPFASILHLGLIWGQNRIAEKWLKSGKIKNGNKLVNFIHVDDLCQIIICLLKQEEQHGRLLVSDGQPVQWHSLAERYDIKLACSECGPESKKIDNHKLLSLLPHDFQFTLP